MKISRRSLSMIAAGLGMIALASIVMGLVTRNKQTEQAEESVTATELTGAPTLAEVTPAAAPAPASEPDDTGIFANVQDDRDGYDHHAWSAPVDEVARRGAGVKPGFSTDDADVGPPGLPTILWIGMGLPANHQAAQASTFDQSSLKGEDFSTLRRGRTEYIFAHGQFAMAVEAIAPGTLDKLEQKLELSDQEVPALHVERIFDMEPAGSGLPPEALRSDCYKRAGTNTRIYVIEKWSTSVRGTVVNHHAWVVTIPNVAYRALLDAANKQTTK